MKPVPRGARVLSWVSASGACLASFAILVSESTFPLAAGVPPQNPVLAEARGWSAATLAVALPLLIAGLLRSQSGSLRGRLAWLGALGYLVYTYLEFAVSPPFTWLFLVYVTTFSSALVALVMGVASLDLEETARAFTLPLPRGLLVGFSWLLGVFLALAWLRGIVEAQLAGDLGWREGPAQVRHVVHALDLGLQVPLALASGALLLRKRPGGYVAMALFLVNSLCMGSALFAMVLSASVVSGQSLLTASPFLGLTAVALLLTWRFFRAICAGPKHVDAPFGTAAAH